MLRWLLRAVVWLSVSLGLLLAGFALFATVILIPSLIQRGELPGEVQREALGAVYSALVTQALLPQLALTGVTWLALARLVPAFDRSRAALAVTLGAIAALWFPAVGRYWFTIWSPTSARDYAFTLLLVAGGAALALWLPRVVSPALAAGCFTTGAARSIVEGE